jgi:hypothetical protein
MDGTRCRPEFEMTPPDSGNVRIRNRRYRPWVEIAGVMLMVLFMGVVFSPFLFDWQNGRLAMLLLFAILGGMAVYCLRMWLLVVDLQYQPLPSRREVAGVLFERVYRGARRPDLGWVAGVTVARTFFGWLVPRRISVAFLLLGENVAFDSRFPVPLRSVRRVRFSPDPAEDYAEWDRPAQYCAAAVELAAGREFRLILDQADAQRLREWAGIKGIPVCDGDGYVPRPAEPATETAGHE